MRNNVEVYNSLKYKPTPIKENTVTEEVETETLRILAIKRLIAAESSTIKATFGSIKSWGTIPLLIVVTTLPPAINAPNRTNKPNSKAALLLPIAPAPYGAAKEGDKPLPPIFIAKNAAKIKVSKPIPFSPPDYRIVNKVYLLNRL